MKKIILLIIALTFYAPYNAYAISEDVIFFELTQSDDHKEIPDKGQRIPSRKETCTIDFASKSICASLEEEILYYELWDELGCTIIVSFFNDYDMVGYMLSLTGFYQLRIVSEWTIYEGYLDL